MRKRIYTAVFLIMMMLASSVLTGCGGASGSDGGAASENESSAMAGPSSAREGFEQYLRDGYDSADYYYGDLPVFYERWEDGTVDQSGGYTWLEFAIADFDGDGEDEMLMYQSFYTGEYSPDASGSLIMYEWENDEVVMKSFCYYRGDLHSDKVCFYDNMVIYDERWYEGGSALLLLMFDSGMRDSFGLRDGDYLSYESVDGDFEYLDRNICSAFSVDDNRRITNEEYMEESESILTGEIIDVELYPATMDGIGEAF